MAEVTSTRDTEIPVFAGSEVLSFSVAQMPPSIQIFVYVNGIEITPFCAPVTSGARIGDAIVTDQLGSATGFIYIPSTEGKYKFPVGEIRLTFADTALGIENSKFTSETTVYNHGLNLVDLEQGSTVSLRTTEKFRADVSGSAGETVITQKKLDPLAQTFVVDDTKYPLGLYLTGVNLFFYTKDESLPVGVELRPVINGKPSSVEYMSGSYTQVLPQDVKIYNTATNEALTTPFTFRHPIYLKPGEYAFCVISKSDKYTLLTAKLGDGKTVKQPFAGTLFRSQNTGEWVGDSNEDLTFILRKAKFETGTAEFIMESPQLPDLEFNRLRLLTTDINFGTTAFADYQMETTAAGSRMKSGLQDVFAQGGPNIKGRQIASQAGDVRVKIGLTSKSSDISPMLDKQLIAAQVFRSVVQPYSQAISDLELNPRPTVDAVPMARYISKIVPLAEGYDSTGIQVQLEVNRKAGTDIEVYARVLAREDKSFTDGINSRNWVRMPLVEPIEKTFSGTDDDLFYQETYKVLEPNFEYTSSTTNIISNENVLSKFNNFAYYQIKVVFYASDPSIVPKIKNLIATSVL